jgi:glyoxylase-like metal-dependent hydrolase (beta-lactamase superfamily II)
MLVAYLPTEKILINADMYSPPPPNAPPPARASTNAREFLQNIQRLKLDVERHVAIHGGVGPHETLVRMVGQASN